MTNALTASSENRTALAQAGGNPFLEMAEEMGGGFAVYMKFNGNSGEYTVGQEADEIPVGSELAADVKNIRKGWICWKDGEVVQEIMVLVQSGEKPPREHELPDHGPYVQTEEQKDGWQEQMAVRFRNLQTGEEYVFKTSSKSGLGGLRDLMINYGKQVSFHPGEVPIVEFATRSWMPKQKSFGKKYSPVFKIKRWVKEEELASAAGDSADDYADAPSEQAQTAPQLAAPAAQAPQQPAEQAAPQTAAPAGDPADKPRPEQRGARRRSF